MKKLAGTIALVLAGISAAPSALLAAPPEGIWSGTANSNIGDTSRCRPTLKWELTSAAGKLTIRLEFVGERVQPVEGTVGEDGSFETGYPNTRGDPVNVKGKIGESFSISNPKNCGYGELSLKP